MFYHNSYLNKKIYSKTANIRSNDWILEDVIIYNLNDGIFVEKKLENQGKLDSLYISIVSKDFNQFITYENY